MKGLDKLAALRSSLPAGPALVAPAEQPAKIDSVQYLARLESEPVRSSKPGIRYSDLTRIRDLLRGSDRVATDSDPILNSAFQNAKRLGKVATAAIRIGFQSHHWCEGTPIDTIAAELEDARELAERDEEIARLSAVIVARQGIEGQYPGLRYVHSAHRANRTLDAIASREFGYFAIVRQNTWAAAGSGRNGTVYHDEIPHGPYPTAEIAGEHPGCGGVIAHRPAPIKAVDALPRGIAVAAPSFALAKF